MRVKPLCGWAALFLAVAGSAAAAPATPEEAQRLTALFQRYTGHPAAGAPSAVTVTPAGQSYRLDLDVGRLLAPLSSLDLNAAVTGPFVATLTPLDDGTWRVQADGFPAVAISKGDQTTTVKYENYKADGVFDPKLEAMRDLTSSMSGFSAGTASPLVSNQQQYTAEITGRQTARDAGDGSVTLDSRQTAANLDYTLTMRVPPAAGDKPQPPISVAAGAAQASTATVLSHLAAPAVLDLWAFLVAHPSEVQVRSDQDRLKAILQTILAPGPLASVKIDASKIDTVTPVGPISLDSYSQLFDLSGDRSTQSVKFGLHYAGLSVSTRQLPPWAAKFLPTALDLDLSVGPLHLYDGLRGAVADADFSEGHPPLTEDQAQKAMHAMVDTGALVLTLSPSTLKSALLSVSAQGTGRMGADNQPSVTVTLTAAGLDAALDTLNADAKDDPVAQQAVSVLTLAKQTAKSVGADRYSWTIDAKPGQPPTVNGAPLSQAPEPDETPDP